MDEEQQRIARQQEIVHREMYRKSRDVWRIFNPLPYNFKFMYDGFWHNIPAQSYKDVEQYLALHFFKKIAEEMIGQQQNLVGNELLERRKKQGLPDFLDKYEENKAIWDKTPKLSDESLLSQIRDTVIIGLVEEYGLEVPDQATSSSPVTGDTRTAYERLFADMKKKSLKKDLHSLETPLKKSLDEVVA